MDGSSWTTPRQGSFLAVRGGKGGGLREKTAAAGEEFMSHTNRMLATIPYSWPGVWSVRSSAPIIERQLSFPRWWRGSCTSNLSSLLLLGDLLQFTFLLSLLIALGGD